MGKRQRASPRRATRGAPKRSEQKQTDSDEEHHSDSAAEWKEEEASSDEDIDAFVKASAERPRKRRTSKRDDCHRTVCPHCQKVLSSQLGYQYHVDQFVCRPDQRPGGPVVRGGRRKVTSDENAKKQYPKIRGKNVADRTCPQCQRVFTSVHGMQYHRDKRVCEQKASSGDATTPYPTLAPGACYVTPYGIVQVICDDRAIPTAVMDTDQVKSQLKLYHNAVAKRDARQQKQCLNVAVVSQARRLLLQRAYNPNGVHAQEVQSIYEVCHRAPTTSSSPLAALEDPSAPPEAHPDRIVEGILIPDQRPRYLGPRRSSEGQQDGADFTLLDGLATSTTTALLPKVFLPRRLLTTLYTPEAARYYCPHCFQCFASKPGYKYHVDLPKEGSCRVKRNAQAAALAEQRRSIEERARQFVAQFCGSTHPPAPIPTHNKPSEASKATAAIARRQPVAHPPTESVPQQDDDTRIVSASMTLPELDSNQDMEEEVEEDSAAFVSPDVVLAELEAEFYRIQGSMIGPMYPSIWKALGYRKPSTKKRKRPPGPRSRRRDAPSEVPSAVPANTERLEIPIVDIYPLVQEVDAGRYPSMKRYSDDNRETQCSICKQGELTTPVDNNGKSGAVDDIKLIPCSFCPQVEHFTCAQTKFLLKYPEPGDDFLCHNCIGVIAARRSRAEKRRLEKLCSTEEASSFVQSASLQQEQLYSSTEPARLKELQALTSGVVRDREFECVAAQGSRLKELSLLLRDAKTRLTVRLEVQKMNEGRHSLIETAYNEDGSELTSVNM